VKGFIENSIKKKLLLTVILIMLVFQFCFPSFVLAAEIITDLKQMENWYYKTEYTMSYKLWVSFFEQEFGVEESIKYVNYLKSGDGNGIYDLMDIKMDFSHEQGEYADDSLYTYFINENRDQYLLEEGEHLIVTLSLWGDQHDDISLNDIYDDRFGEDSEKWKKHLIDNYQNYEPDEKEDGEFFNLTYNEYKQKMGFTNDDEAQELLIEPLVNWLNEGGSGVDVEFNKDIVKDMLNTTNEYKYIDKLLIDINVNKKEVLAVSIDNLNSMQLDLYVDGYLKDNTPQEDAGGFLLDLIFPFVNFLADILHNFLGRAMNDGIEAITKTTQQPDNLEGLTKDNVIEIDNSSFGGEKVTPVLITYSPEEIFSGKIHLLSIDFISGKAPLKDENGNLIKDENGNIKYDDNKNPGWNNIRQVIAEWYKVLRMVAIIGLLSVLIYTGIKILISANAKDKAKYKEWIINWFIAVAILFFMHYIMAFVISITGQFSQLLGASSGNVVIEVCDGRGTLSSSVNTENVYVTNLMGYVRTMVDSNNMMMKIGYEVMYIALLVYTFKFTFIYLKRVLNMAFLTLIAPIVALTYPIDKLNDGSAQGFGMWLKEYIFNALLQPMHYIMYYILLSSAIGIAAKNPLYAIVVLAFMTEAEKLLKKIFGFDKAGGGTVGGMAGAFAAGALASNVKNIARMAGKLSSGHGGNAGSGSEKNPLDNPKGLYGNDFTEFDGPEPGQAQLGAGIAQQQQQQQQQEQQEKEADLESERRTLEEFKAEKNLRPEDKEELQKLEEELAEKEARQRQQQLAAQQRAGDSGNSVRQMAAAQEERREESKFKKGLKAVGRGSKALGKRIVKPVWDTDKSRSYNFKRIAKGAAKGALGLGLGITAAAVQAGISITDGKYNPMEGIGTFAAGFVGGKGVVDGVTGMIGGGIDTFRDGYTAGDKEAQMERAQRRFADRDDVIAFNKREFASDPKAAMKRQRDYYLPNGVTDLKEMKSGMKYADKLKATGMSQEAADSRAAKVLNFKKQLKDQGQGGAIYDKKKQDEYIDAMVKQAKPEDQARIRTRYQNLFSAAQAFDKAQG